MNSDYINIDPTDSNNLIIGDENKNLTFKSNQYIRFERNSIPDNDEGFINLALGNGSGANTVVYDTQQQMENDTNVVDKMFAYRTDLNGLFIRINNEWKQISSVSVQDDGQGNVSFVTLNYAEKDKNEEIEGTWTFKENTTFEKNVNANQVITDTIHSNQFQSGSNGWRLQDDSLEIENLTVRNKLKTNVFEIDKIKATNGTLYVSNCTTLTYVGDEPEVSTRGTVETPQSPSNDFTGVTKYVTFRENVFEVGDIIQCHNLNKNYKAIVLASNQIQLESDSIGSPAIEDEVVKIDSTVESRNGTVLLTSDLDNTPYVDIKKGNVTKVRLGNLSGINDQSFTNNNINIEGYGLYANNAYITGKFILSNGQVLANYDDTSITTQVGNINTTVQQHTTTLGTQSDDINELKVGYTGLGSRITQTENAIETLVVGDNIFISSDPSDETIETLQERWHCNTLSISDGYILNSNKATMYQISNSKVTLQSGEELEFVISSKSNIESLDSVFAKACLATGPDPMYSCSNEISLEYLEGKHKYTFTLNQSIYKHDLYLIIYNFYGTITDLKFYFRNESVTRNIYSIISQSGSSIEATVTNNIAGKLVETGIKINGNDKGITAKADNFKIVNSNDEPTFGIDSEGNLEAAGGATFKGVLTVPYDEHLITEDDAVYLDLENIKNKQIAPRLTSNGLIENTDNGKFLPLFLPGFSMIEDNSSLHTDGKEYVHIINKYGKGNEYFDDLQVQDVPIEKYGTNLELYHQWCPIYQATGNDKLNLSYSSDPVLSGNDAATDIAVLIIPDYKLSGQAVQNINVENQEMINPYLISANIFIDRNQPQNVSSGWILSNKDVVKGVLLNPGYTLKLKSVKIDNLKVAFSQNSTYHTNVWVVQNPELFEVIDAIYIILKGTDLNSINNYREVFSISQKMLVCKDSFPIDDLKTMIGNSNKHLTIELLYDPNGDYIDHRWSIK